MAIKKAYICTCDICGKREELDECDITLRFQTVKKPILDEQSGSMYFYGVDACLDCYQKIWLNTKKFVKTLKKEREDHDKQN